MPALSADMERRLVCPAHTNYFKWLLIIIYPIYDYQVFLDCSIFKKFRDFFDPFRSIP